MCGYGVVYDKGHSVMCVGKEWVYLCVADSVCVFVCVFVRKRVVCLCY